MEIRRRSTFWSRARGSSRSSGPSKPSRLTISSPSPGAITSGPAVLKPSAGGGVTGSFMLLRFNPAVAPAATVFAEALSPFGQQRGHAPGGLGQSCSTQRSAVAGEKAPSGLEPAFRRRRPPAGAAGDLDHLVHTAVTVQGDVAARRQRPRRPLAQ